MLMCLGHVRVRSQDGRTVLVAVDSMSPETLDGWYTVSPRAPIAPMVVTKARQIRMTNS